MPLDFKPPPSSPGSPTQLREDNKTYMWLCYIMLTNFILGERSACEAFESALVMVQGRKDLELIWIEYLRFVASKTKSPSLDSIPSLAKLVHRCLLSTATQFPLPFSRSGETWNDFSFHNRVIALYMEQVHDGERMEEYEKLQLQMPDNVILAYRACQYAVESGFSQLGLQIAYSALHRSPDSVIFWKIVISLALQSQRYKEVRGNTCKDIMKVQTS
nr:zinc finger C3H1 domain-containing protein-like [Lytechinus pictus]